MKRSSQIVLIGAAVATGVSASSIEVNSRAASGQSSIIVFHDELQNHVANVASHNGLIGKQDADHIASKLEVNIRTMT